MGQLWGDPILIEWVDASRLSDSPAGGWALALAAGHLGLLYLVYRVGFHSGLRRERRRRAGRAEARTESRAVPPEARYPPRGLELDVAGQVAHAIHTPLAALAGTAEMRLESAREDPDWQRIVVLARRIRSTVQRMLELSRGRVLRLAPVSAFELLDQVAIELGDACKRADVELSTRVDAELRPFLADPTLVATALVSVAENAVDALAGGGEISLEATRVPGGAADVVGFRVADSGPGVPPELRAKLLEPFVSGRGARAGLGLAIANGIAREHGGRIRIEDNPGGGTLVCFEIPLRAVPAEARTKARTESRARPQVPALPVPR